MNGRWMGFWLSGLCLGAIIVLSAYYDVRGRAGGVRFFCLDPQYATAYHEVSWHFSPSTLLPGLWQERLNLQLLADTAALRHGLDPRLFRALITHESDWKADAISPKGALGLAQVMPETGKSACGLSRVELLNPAKNLDCGAYYLAHQIKRFGDVKTALCAYNAGPTITARLGRCPNYRETQRYVSLILSSWKNSGGV
jgi:soluble lytic murein transglycosylase-like protein